MVSNVTIDRSDGLVRQTMAEMSFDAVEYDEGWPLVKSLFHPIHGKKQCGKIDRQVGRACAAQF